MNTKIKFENIKGMLQREEMKKIAGGEDAYDRQRAPSIAPINIIVAESALWSATAPFGATTYNYGGGLVNGTDKDNPAYTFTNAATLGNGSAPKPTGTPQYGRP
jgi:hypothetical protein